MKKCYMCNGVNGHTGGCPELRDEQARDKLFPGRKPIEVTPISPLIPSKSSHADPFELGEIEATISIDGRAFYDYGCMEVSIREMGILQTKGAICHRDSARYLLNREMSREGNSSLTYQAVNEDAVVRYVHGTICFVSIEDISSFSSRVSFRYIGSLKK